MSKKNAEEAKEVEKEKVAETENVETVKENGILISKENFEVINKVFGWQGVDISNDDVITEAIKKLEDFNKDKEESEKLKVVLIDAGWSGKGSAVGVAREYILSVNSELQVLDTVLIANKIKEADSNIHPVAAAAKFITNLEKTEQVEGRELAKGTTLVFGGETVVLNQNTFVNYVDEANEQKFVGLCINSGCLDVNRGNLRFQYDGLGRKLEDD